MKKKKLKHRLNTYALQTLCTLLVYLIAQLQTTHDLSSPKSSPQVSHTRYNSFLTPPGKNEASRNACSLSRAHAWSSQRIRKLLWNLHTFVDFQILHCVKIRWIIRSFLSFVSWRICTSGGVLNLAKTKHSLQLITSADDCSKSQVRTESLIHLAQLYQKVYRVT